VRTVAILGIIVLGVCFRFTHLSNKGYWHDEVYTSLWLSGFDPSQQDFEAFDGHERSASYLLRYQCIHPERGLVSTIQTIARNDAQHPPLFYGLAWLWARWFHDSTAALRALSAFLGLLVLPATYSLCMEALGSRCAAWMGTLLVAVSPIHVVYAQEAREYSLWTLMIVLSTAALLFARRNGKASGWLLYGTTALLGLYSHGLFPLVMLAHAGWFVVIIATLEWHGDSTGRRLLKSYLVTSLAAAALFAPWAWVALKGLSRINECISWMGTDSQWGNHAELWAINFGTVIVDEIVDSEVGMTILRVIALLFGLGGLLVSWRYPRREVWLLAVVLLTLPLVILAAPDLMWGGQRSMQPRFLFPGYIGMMLAMVHLLTPWLESENRRDFIAGNAMAVLMLTFGLVSCAIFWHSTTWWNKGHDWADRRQAADVINASPHPLVLSGPVTGPQLGETLGLAHLLKPHVRFRVLSESTLAEIPPGFTDVYLVNVSEGITNPAGIRLRLERLALHGQVFRWRAD
jgi:uncharacterized membrane protein